MRLSERGDTAKWPKTWACPRGSLAKRNARKSTTSLHRVMVERETTRLRRENQQRARGFKRHSWRQVKYEFVEMNCKPSPSQQSAECSAYHRPAWRGRYQMSARARSNEALGVEIRAIHRQYKQRSQDAL